MRHEVFLIYGRSVTLSCLRPTQPAISRKPRNSGGVRCSSKWTVTQAHPLGEAIKKAGYDGRGFSKSMRPPMVHIVSEQLCDDALQRLAPYLQRKAPVDIIDLWPGAGLWSSKVYDFLQPRRHVLLETNLATYQPLLTEVLKTRPNMQLLSSHDPFLVRNWKEVLEEALPEFVESRRRSGRESVDETPLILANTPAPASKKSHFTPARWWAMFIDDFLRGKGLHSYGPARTIAWMPSTDAYSVIPQSVCDRKRPAMLTEAAAVHAFHVATTSQSDSFVSRDWDTLVESAARAKQRAADANIITPAGREMEPLEMAPKISNPGLKPVAYEPRPMTEWHKENATAFADYEREETKYRELKEKGDAAGLARPAMPRSVIRLGQENRRFRQIRHILNIVQQLDELDRALADAMEDSGTGQIIKNIEERLESRRAVFNVALSQLDVKSREKCLNWIDDWRAAMSTASSTPSPGRNLDEAVLLWDRRPFEPLRIDAEELYPQESPSSLFYFEPDLKSPVLRELRELAPNTLDEVVALLSAILSTLGPQSTITVSTVLGVLFPERSSAAIVRAVPRLAPYGSKRFDPVALDMWINEEFGAYGGGGGGGDGLDQLFPSADDDPSSSSTSTTSSSSSTRPKHPSKRHYSSRHLHHPPEIEYDFSAVRVRSMPVLVLWDLVKEYHRTSPFRQDAVQLSRALGGTLTEYQAGEDDSSSGWRPKMGRGNR